MSDYSTIQQHQPLRVPQDWSQLRSMISQLEEILDDIYRRFGRLRVQDLGKDLRQFLEDTEGNFVEIKADIDGIELTVGNKYDKVSGISIIQDGIEISGNKYVKIKSGSLFQVQSGGTVDIFATDDNSVIRFGGTEENPNFSLGKGGQVKATKVVTGELEVTGGAAFLKTSGQLAEVIVADSEPQDVHGVLWLKPTGSTGTVDFISNSGGTDMTNWNASQSLTCTLQGSALTGSSFAYGCKFSIYTYGVACYLDSITVQLQRADGTGSAYTLYSHTYNHSTDVQMLRPGDSLDIDTLADPVTIADNLTGGNVKLTVSVTKSDANGDPVNSGAHFAVGQNTIVRCSGTGSATALACDVKYIP